MSANNGKRVQEILKNTLSSTTHEEMKDLINDLCQVEENLKAFLKQFNEQ